MKYGGTINRHSGSRMDPRDRSATLPNARTSASSSSSRYSPNRSSSESSRTWRCRHRRARPRLRSGSRGALAARAARRRVCRRPRPLAAPPEGRGRPSFPARPGRRRPSLLSRRRFRLHLGVQHHQPPGRSCRSAARASRVVARRRPTRARAERIPARHVLCVGRTARGRHARGLPSRLS